MNKRGPTFSTVWKSKPSRFSRYRISGCLLPNEIHTKYGVKHHKYISIQEHIPRTGLKSGMLMRIISAISSNFNCQWPQQPVKT